MEIPYPEKIIEVMEKYFPKGNKKRGEALVLQAVAYLEGKEHREKEILQVIDEMLEKKDNLVKQGNVLPKGVQIPFINGKELKQRILDRE
jgi:hypothetical protein